MVKEGEFPRRRRSKLGQSKHQRKLQAEGIQELSFKELIKLNFPDWYFVLIGIVCSAIIGALFPLMAILFSEVLRVGQNIGYIRVCCFVLS